MRDTFLKQELKSGITKIDEEFGFLLSGKAEDFYTYYIHSEKNGERYIVRLENGLYLCENHQMVQELLSSNK